MKNSSSSRTSSRVYNKIKYHRHLSNNRKRQRNLVLIERCGNDEQILLVEDELAVRKFVLKLLQKTGYKVTSVCNAQDAIKNFKENDIDYHLVISDIKLFDMTGIELVNKLVQIKPDLGVILCSGYLDEKSQWPIIQKKGYRFLKKPYDITELLTAVKEVIQK